MGFGTACSTVNWFKTDVVGAQRLCVKMGILTPIHTYFFIVRLVAVKDF